ncbi:MAG: hypothetical protein ACI35W_02205, partial [Anaeroplasmataceae bacterium]
MKKRRKKRLIVLLSLVVTVCVAVILFCAITGFNLKTFIFGTKASGNVVSEETTLETTLKPVPTDGSTPLDYSAADNFAMLAYNIEEKSYFECNITGAAVANYNGMNVSQGVNDYRMVTPDYAIVDTRSSSTFVKVFEETFYTKDKVLLRSGSSANYDAFQVQARSIKQQRALVGYGPDKLTGYIVCPETIINSPEVIQNEDGTFTSVYLLDPSVAPVYYQRKVKYNASIADYPRFSKVELTVTYNSNWEVISIGYDESYTIYKMNSWIVTNNKITEQFTFLDSSAQVPKYDFYKDYFDMEVPDFDEDEEAPSYEMGSLDYIGTLANLISGKYMSLDVTLNVDGKEVLAYVTVNLTNLETQIQIEDTYYVFKDNKIYVKAIDNKYIDLQDLEPIISLIMSLKESIPSSPSNGEFSDVESSSSFDIDSMISQIMEDISSGTVTKVDDKTIVDVNLHFGSIELPVYFNFYTPEGEIKFENLGTSYNINGKDISLDIVITQENRTLIEIDDSFVKAPLSLNSTINATVTIDDVIYDVTGEFYVDLMNLTMKLDLLLSNDNREIKLKLTYLNERVYISLNGIKLVFRINDFIKLINNFLPKNVDVNTDTNLDTKQELDMELIKSYLTKISYSLSDGLTLTYDEAISYENIVIDNIELNIINSDYETIIIENENEYITTNDIIPFIDFVSTFDKENAVVLFNLDALYENDNINLTGEIHTNNSYVNVNANYLDNNVNIRFYEDNIYISYGEFKYYLIIEEFKSLINTTPSFDIEIPNTDANINDIINYVFVILENLEVISTNNNINVSYENINLSLNVSDNKLIINLASVEYDGILLNSLNINIYNDTNIYTVNTNEYQRISTINSIQSSAEIVYDSVIYNMTLNSYINFEELSMYANVIISTEGKNLNVNVIYKDEMIYLELDNMFVKLDVNSFKASEVTLPESNNNVDVLVLVNILRLLDVTPTNGITISLKDKLEIANITFNTASISINSTSYEEINVDEEKYIDVTSILELFDVVSENFMMTVDTKVTYVYEGTLLEVTV